MTILLVTRKLPRFDVIGRFVARGALQIGSHRFSLVVNKLFDQVSFEFSSVDLSVAVAVWALEDGLRCALVDQTHEGVGVATGGALQRNVVLLFEELAVVDDYGEVSHVLLGDLLVLSVERRPHEFCQLVHVHAHAFHGFEQPPYHRPDLVLQLVVIIWFEQTLGPLDCGQVKRFFGLVIVAVHDNAILVAVA